jgi:hypothetical protein
VNGELPWPGPSRSSRRKTIPRSASTAWSAGRGSSRAAVGVGLGVQDTDHVVERGQSRLAPVRRTGSARASRVHGPVEKVRRTSGRRCGRRARPADAGPFGNGALAPPGAGRPVESREQLRRAALRTRGTRTLRRPPPRPPRWLSPARPRRASVERRVDSAARMRISASTGSTSERRARRTPPRPLERLGRLGPRRRSISMTRPISHARRFPRSRQPARLRDDSAPISRSSAPPASIHASASSMRA